MTKSLFNQLGGAAAINAATDLFYEKVLADDRINHFFDGVDMKKQKVKQKTFLTLAFGGPNKYKGKSLEEGHAHLVQQGLNDSHFDAVMENLGATLTELGVPAELIGEAATIAESVRGDVLGKNNQTDSWTGWTKTKECDQCTDYAILADENGKNRVMLGHAKNCSEA
jgi:hemoglobin